jgi:transcriptional regulator with XRE-family HTH domain
MSPEQCRAARGWLGWSQQDLAKQAKVGLSTVKDFENGSRRPIANNLTALQGALEAGGVRLTFDPKGSPLGIEGAQKPKGAGEGSLGA